MLADAWAISASHATPLVVVTAITAQGARFSSTPVAPALIGRQLDAALEARPAAVKLGMIPTRAALDAIVARLRRAGLPTVIDPVVRTSRGQRLSALSAADYLRLGGLLPRAVLTPNLAERAWLGPHVRDAGFAAVVVKGSDTATDEVLADGVRTVLRGTRLPRSTSHHRGTGCRFGSGLAVGLGRGEDVVAATRNARRLVRKFLSSL